MLFKLKSISDTIFNVKIFIAKRGVGGGGGESLRMKSRTLVEKKNVGSEEGRHF